MRRYIEVHITLSWETTKLALFGSVVFSRVNSFDRSFLMIEDDTIRELKRLLHNASTVLLS